MPVFVLGSVRSATSTVLEILRQYGGFAGHTEGHFWPLLSKLQRLCLAHFQDNELPFNGTDLGSNETIPMVVDLGLAQINRLMEDIFRAAVTNHYARDWVDKTPGHQMISTAPLLRQIFPSAKFVYCYREPRANLASRVTKFPTQDFESHCIDLALCWRAWLSVRGDLHDACLTLAQSDLRDDFAPTAARLLSFATGSAVTCPKDRSPVAIESLNRGIGVIWTSEMENLYQQHCAFIEELNELKVDSTPTSSPRLSYRQNFLPIISYRPIIRMQSSMEPITSIICNESDERGHWLFLHPGSFGDPRTQVIFESFVFSGERHFSTTANVNNGKSGAVRFCLEVRESASSAIVLQAAIVIGALESRLWTVEFSALYGKHDVWLSTEMAGPDLPPSFAWARLLAPAFLTSHASPDGL